MKDLTDTRKKEVDEAMKPVDADDAIASIKKQQAAGYITNLLNYKNNQAAVIKMGNQQSLNVIRAMEAQLTAAGRILFGTKWSEKPCGLGMADSKCSGPKVA